MASVTLNISVDQIKAALPAQLGPVIDESTAIFQAWGATTLQAWIALAKADAAAARAQLLDAMTDAQRTRQTQADVAALDAEVVANADRQAAVQQALADAWHAILIVAAGLVTVAL